MSGRAEEAVRRLETRKRLFRRQNPDELSEEADRVQSTLLEYGS
jgi:hypothetical protein